MSNTTYPVDNTVFTTPVSGNTTTYRNQYGGTPTPTSGTSTYSGSGRLKSGSGVPGWVGPVVGCLGGLLLVLIVIVAVVLVRRRRHRNHDLPPIHDQMYVDYKVDKRAPLPVPRSDDGEANSKQNDKVMVRTQTYDYAYGKSKQSKKSRQMEKQPSIEQPHEYLEFSNPADEEYATIP